MQKLTTAIGTIVLATLLHAPLSAQESVQRGPSGLLIYKWSNLPHVAAGDTLRIRHVAFNAGDARADLPVSLCDFEFESAAQVRLLDTDCSADHGVQPGDSMWAEKRWLVEAGSGSYAYAILEPDPRGGVPVATSSGTWELPEHRRSPERKPRRLLPVLLDVSGIEHKGGVSRWDIESVIDHAAMMTRYIVAFGSPASLERLARGAPYLAVLLRFEPGGSHELSACWMHEGVQMEGRCRRSRARMPPMMLGVTLNEIVTGELRAAAALER
jgi:hypothetical protein